MKFQISRMMAVGVMLFAAALVRATAQADTNSAPADSRFGLFNALDRRSAYNREFFPQPLLVDDTGLEPDGELELNSLHTRANDQHSDNVAVGFQKSFGALTFELGVPYEREADADDVARGVGNIDLDARCPLYQFVSATRFFDTTFGVAMEAGIPVNSAVSKNAELAPKIFNDLKLGEHFSVQTILGYDTLFGGGENGGQQTFEYGFDFAWAIPRHELPLPGVGELTPMFELAGETGLNKDESGQNSLLASIGFRLDFKPVGDVQPSLGLGYVFPIDSGARAEVHWGLATSFTLEF